MDVMRSVARAELAVVRVFAILVLVLAPVVATPEAQAQVGVGATLFVVQDPVEVAAPGGLFQPAFSGQSLGRGDSVRTGEAGIALLTYFDGSETQLVGSTELRIDAVPSQTSGPNAFQSVGTTVNRTAPRPPGSSGSQTGSPSAVALVRGTTYVVNVRRLGPTAVPTPAAPALVSELLPGAMDGEVQQPETTGETPVVQPVEMIGEPEGTQDPAPEGEGEQTAQSLARQVPSAQSAVASAITTVLLLADRDGRVGRVDVAPPVGGTPLVLAAAGQVAAADPTLPTGPAIVSSTLPPTLLQQWQQGVQDLRDPLAAQAVQRLATAGLVGTPGSGSSSPSPPPPPSTSSISARVLELINRVRAANGVAPLAENNALNVEAQRYSEVLRDTGCNGHQCEVNASFDDRLARAGYGLDVAAAENIARGETTPEEAVAFWIGSEIHHGNQIDPNMKSAGAGLARGGPLGFYWVLILVDR